jgi:signal transduction histidine kinase
MTFCNRSSNLRRFHRSAISPAPSLVLDRTKKSPTGDISTITHEIRNPLCNIYLALDMLSPMDLDEDMKLYLNIIRRGAGRIKDLVNDLLLPERVKEAASEVYSIHQMLDEVLVMAIDRVSLKKIAIYREYNATEQRVSLHGEKMKIALTNIIINAIDAMPAAGGELRLVTRSTGNLCSLEIQDNGIGISKEGLKRIFEPYYTNKPGGMGLGLSATLDILKANHTRVDVRSEEGVGTSFILSFGRG